MDAIRFDAVARAVSGRASRRALTGGLAGALLGLLHRPGVDAQRKDQRQKNRSNGKGKDGEQGKDNARDDLASAAREKKFALCHQGQTISVSKKQKKKHLKHGDTVGPCPTSPPAPSPVAPPVSPPVSPPAPPPVPPAGCVGAVNPCGNRACGTAIDSCGVEVPCGRNNGGCAGDDFCHQSSGQCLPAACRNCNGCCSAEGACVAGDQRQACGYGSGRCESCNPEVSCVNGECTCSNGISCGQGCCSTDQNGRPFCDNTKRPCGNTCIPKEQCCTGVDASSSQSIQPGCLPNETCAVNASGFGECRCGSGGRCQRNQGCCTLVNGQPSCNPNLRPCGATCISREQCCNEGQATVVGAECDDGVSCTSVTCQTFTGTGTALGICEYAETAGACPEACQAGFGYGNQFPEKQREVRCGSVNGQPCYCWRTTEGENRCTHELAGAPACRRSSECGSGEVCMRSGLTTGANRCARICQ